MHGGCQRDLDVDLDVRGVDAYRVVDGVGVAAPALQTVGDAALLGNAEVCALADHLGTHFHRGDADRVVGAVADFSVGFGRRFHVGADAAEPEQVDRALQDRHHDLEGRGYGLVDADRGNRFRRQRD